MPWTHMMLRGQKVLARCDAEGRPIAEGGRVEVRYKPNDGRAYRAGISNLSPVSGATILDDEHCAPAEAPPPKETTKAKSSKKKIASAADTSTDTSDRVAIYADGACSGNPGPAGLGVVVYEGDARRELSEFLGIGTNNVAELTAIQRAAELFADDPRSIDIRTDSQYSIGVLTKGWKAKANVELIAAVKAALSKVDGRVRLTYVPGHAGVAGNERADELARAAIVARATSGWVTTAK